MDSKQLSQLILYIVHQVEDLGGYTTTIRLIKFLYLIDLEHQRRYGRTLTGLQWVYHRFGPYAFEIANIGDRLGLDLEREEFVSAKGYQGVLFHASEPQEFPPELSYGIEVMVNGLLRVWADLETPDLLRYVYCTEPMRHARRGDRLDFSVVPPGTRYYELHIPVQKATARRLRESLRSYAQEDAGEFVRPDTIHDDALEEWQRTLADEGSIPDLTGTMVEVVIDELKALLPCED